MCYSVINHLIDNFVITATEAFVQCLLSENKTEEMKTRFHETKVDQLPKVKKKIRFYSTFHTNRCFNSSKLFARTLFLTADVYKHCVKKCVKDNRVDEHV